MSTNPIQYLLFQKILCCIAVKVYQTSIKVYKRSAKLPFGPLRICRRLPLQERKGKKEKQKQPQNRTNQSQFTLAIKLTKRFIIGQVLKEFSVCMESKHKTCVSERRAVCTAATAVTLTRPQEIQAFAAGPSGAIQVLRGIAPPFGCR